MLPFVKEIDNEESLYSPPSMMIDRKEAHKALYVKVVIIMMISQAIWYMWVGSGPWTIL